MKYFFYSYSGDSHAEYEIDENNVVQLAEVIECIIADNWDDGSFELLIPPTKPIVAYAPDGQGFRFLPSGDIESVESNPEKGKEVKREIIKNRKEKWG